MPGKQSALFQVSKSLLKEDMLGAVKLDKIDGSL
jgi:hypothetical protein